MSRASRIALMIWACSKIALAGAMIYQVTENRIPFARADEKWWVAYRANDFAGMQAAHQEMCAAIRASLFYDGKECR